MAGLCGLGGLLLVVGSNTPTPTSVGPPPVKDSFGLEIDEPASAAVADLKYRVVMDDLYPWTTIACLVFSHYRLTEHEVHVRIGEIHDGVCPGDPFTQPTVDFFCMNRHTGQWYVKWPAPEEGWLTYEAYRLIQRVINKQPMAWNAEAPDPPLRRFSPDGQFYAVVRTFGFRYVMNADMAPRKHCGHVWIGRRDDNTRGVPWDGHCRGMAVCPNVLIEISSGGSMVPRNLQWDSTEPFLYFELGGSTATSGVWRVNATNFVPRYVSATRERYRLIPQRKGPDWVMCNQIRDGQSLWYAYTPEDIAQAVHTFSTHEIPQEK